MYPLPISLILGTGVIVLFLTIFHLLGFQRERKREPYNQINISTFGQSTSLIRPNLEEIFKAPIQLPSLVLQTRPAISLLSLTLVPPALQSSYVSKEEAFPALKFTILPAPPVLISSYLGHFVSERVTNGKENSIHCRVTIVHSAVPFYLCNNHFSLCTFGVSLTMT